MSQRPATFSEAGPYWAVAQVTPGHEDRARDALDALRFETFLPKVKNHRIVRRKIGKKTSHDRVVFYEMAYPGYVFFKIVTAWVQALGLDENKPQTFVSRVLMEYPQAEHRNILPPRPACVPDWFISEVRGIMDDHNGYLPAKMVHRFMSGQMVTVRDFLHSMYGHSGVYECQASHERGRVLMDLLGRKVPVIIDEKDLVAA